MNKIAIFLLSFFVLVSAFKANALMLRLNLNYFKAKDKENIRKFFEKKKISREKDLKAITESKGRERVN